MHRCLIASILMGSFALDAIAEQMPPPICPERPIVVGMYEFGHYYHAGTGLDKDVADLLAARSGCRFELRLMLRSQIWHALQDGSVDMTLSAAATPERTAFSWALPYLWVKNMVVLRKEVAPEVNTMTAFLASPRLRLGVARGHVSSSAYDNFVTQLRNIGRVEDVDDTQRLFAMFNANRFQALLAAPLVYTRYLNAYKLSGQVRIEDWAPEGGLTSVNLLISKKNFTPDEAHRWAAVLRGLSLDGSLKASLEKYTSKDVAKSMLTPPRVVSQ